MLFRIILVCVCVCARDGMVKRPGNESYLMKVVEEERKAYSQGLEVFSPSEEGDQSESQSSDEDNTGGVNE